MKSKGLPVLEDDEIIEWKIENDDKFIYVNGSTIKIIATSPTNFDDNCEWHFIIDNIEYTIEDLKDYFSIQIKENVCFIKAINKIMAKYIITIAIFDLTKSYYDSIDLEVKL